MVRAAYAVVSGEDLVLGSLGIVASVLYIFVAWVQSKRPVSRRASGALNGFILWWGGLGLLGVYGVITRFVVDPLEYGLWGYRLVLYPLIVMVLAMCAGLVYYLLFLYTGKPRVLWLTIAFFAVWFALFLASFEGYSPAVGDDPSTLAPGPEAYTLEQPPAWLDAAVGLGLILPLLGSAIAYALLYGRVEDRTGRYRIALVSLGFVLWFLYSAFGTLSRLVTGDEGESFARQLLGQLFGLLAAGLTLLAYNPPASLRQRYGLRGIGDE